MLQVPENVFEGNHKPVFIPKIQASVHTDAWIFNSLCFFTVSTMRRNADRKFDCNRYQDYQQRNDESVQHRLCAGAAVGI